MNIINKFLLRAALLPKPLFKKMGIDVRHLKVILETKLLMDDRRPTTLHQARANRKEKAVNMATLGDHVHERPAGVILSACFFIGPG
jgi:ABC-2 type transport system permease protein